MEIFQIDSTFKTKNLMRVSVLFNPRLLLEKLASESSKRRRLAKLKNTPAKNLKAGHIDSLEFLEFIKLRFTPSVIYDIGANIGTWALLAKSIFAESRIECFEPLETHFDEFNKNTKAISNINLNRVALGSQNSKMEINITSFTDASSLLEVSNNTEVLYNIFKSGSAEVDVVKLDDYIEANSIPYPDMMKLDIQGYELEALKGASKCLDSAKYVVLEVCFEELYIGQPLFEEVVNYMSSNGYRAVAFADSIITNGVSLTYTDILFENRRAV